jgi:lysophospholipase L1-like esterase
MQAARISKLQNIRTYLSRRKLSMSITRRSLIGAFAAVALLTSSIAHAADGAAKRIMVYGDSNTWGFIPVESGSTTRYPADVRWPGILKTALGQNYEVIEEGLSARTTDIPDPTLPHISGAGLDGSAYLSSALATHQPLDLIVIMLGTNDVKKMFDRSPYRIALGMGKLIDIVAQTKGGVGTSYPTPRVLVLAPPPLGKLFPEARAERFAGGVEKTKAIPGYYEAVAKAAGAEFLDVGTLTTTDGIDGVHLSPEAHKAIGIGVAERVKSILQ